MELIILVDGSLPGETNKWKQGKLTDGSDCLVPYVFNPVINEKGDYEIRNGETLLASRPNSDYIMILQLISTKMPKQRMISISYPCRN